MARSTFLFVSLADPLLADLAWQIRREGHEVRYYMDSETESDIGDGFVEKVDDWRANVDWVRDNPAPYVIKPLGEVQNVKQLLYVGQDADGSDVIDLLEAYEQAWGHRMKRFQLQRRVEGVEVAVCGFFDGERFVEPINLNVEHHFRDLLYNSSQSVATQTEITAA